MLNIDNLHVEIDNKEILTGLNLKIKPGEIHAIMGPNGAGKSTLGNVLAGNLNYAVTKGQISFSDQDLLELTAEQRAHLGLFLSFQYPIEIPGISNMEFLKASIDALYTAQEKTLLKTGVFIKKVRELSKLAKLSDNFLKRGVNSGFSGGEKKRNELLQMLLLEPKLAILDETDSGLDIDALKIVADGVNSMRDQDRSFILITHYQRLLNYIEPDFVHVLANGKIIKSGGKELALELEEKGYSWIDED